VAEPEQGFALNGLNVVREPTLAAGVLSCLTPFTALADVLADAIADAICNAIAREGDASGTPSDRRKLCYVIEMLPTGFLGNVVRSIEDLAGVIISLAQRSGWADRKNGCGFDDGV
jgi:hypothetical protein